MSFNHSFDPKSTSISFSWPSTVTGLERIFLSAKGDLQNVLSAYFAQPITVSVEYTATTSPIEGALEYVSPAAVKGASQENPLHQTRQVHLACRGDIVCTATSDVRMSSPEVARIFLLDKYPIGQTFKKLGQAPEFKLHKVGFGDPNQPSLVDSNAYMWRKYSLTVDQFECNILEVFHRQKLSPADTPYAPSAKFMGFQLFNPLMWKSQIF